MRAPRSTTSGRASTPSVEPRDVENGVQKAVQPFERSPHPAERLHRLRIVGDLPLREPPSGGRATAPAGADRGSPPRETSTWPWLARSASIFAAALSRLDSLLLGDVAKVDRDSAFAGGIHRVKRPALQGRRERFELDRGALPRRLEDLLWTSLFSVRGKASKIPRPSTSSRFLFVTCSARSLK